MWVDVYEHWAMPPLLAGIAIVLALTILGWTIVAAFSRARHRARLAADAEASVGSSPPPLVEGTDVVLWGVVRHFEDHDVAVKVSITQQGDEAESSGSWSHSWTEIDREIVLAPFLLELPSGQHVLVTPPKNVDVADALDQKVWIDRNKRVLSAELVPGEHIYARGRLERSDQAIVGGAYRDVQWGWALQPAGDQMLLSSEPMGAGLRQRVAFHRRMGWVALGCLLAIQVLLGSYYARLVGTTAPEVLDHKHYFQTRDSDDRVDDHYEIQVRGSKVEIPHGDFVRVENGDTLLVRSASADNWNLGPDATIIWWRGVVILGVAIAMSIWYRARRRRSRPWFRRKVDETSLPGRLPDHS